MVFDVKMHLALHVDVLERHGRDVFRGKRLRWRVADDSLHRLGVRGHDDVGEQRRRVGDCGDRTDRSAVPGFDPTGHQGALEKVDGFALHEHAVNFAPECRIDQIVEEEQAAHHLADQGAAFENRRALCGAAMPVKDRDRRSIAHLERC